MSLLDQLWDDTVAGPRPESGLGKLRKYASFSPSSSSSSSIVAASADAAAFAPNITRSISIIRTPPSSAASSPRGASVPSSPAAAAPDSPFASRTRRGSWEGLRRKPTTPTAERTEKVGPRSPNVYDWMVISSLDR